MYTCSNRSRVIRFFMFTLQYYELGIKIKKNASAMGGMVEYLSRCTYTHIHIIFFQRFKNKFLVTIHDGASVQLPPKPAACTHRRTSFFFFFVWFIIE